MGVCPNCGAYGAEEVVYNADVGDAEWIDVICSECYATVSVNDYYDAFLNSDLR